MTPALETISQSLNYGDLPETWRVPDIERFSPDKTLYDYQEDSLRNAHYQDGEQLEIDSMKSPFEQYVFFGDDKLAHAVKLSKKPSKDGKLKINLRSLYADIDIAESLSNVLGKPIRKRTADSATFTDGTTKKINPAKMTAAEQQDFISLIKPYLWGGLNNKALCLFFCFF